MRSDAIEFQTVYSAAIERQATLAQQRPAEKPAPVQKIPSDTIRHDVLRFLSERPTGAFTVPDVADALKYYDYYAVYNAMRYWEARKRVGRVYPGRGRRGRPQRYRWTE